MRPLLVGLVLLALCSALATAQPTPVPKPAQTPVPRPFDLHLVSVQLRTDATMRPLSPPPAVPMGKVFHMRFTVRNLGPGSSPAATARCLFLAAGLPAQVREYPVKRLAPGAETHVEVAARLHFAASYVVDCSVDPGLTPDRSLDNNRIGAFLIVPPEDH